MARPRKLPTAILVALLAALPLLYAFSIGPAALLWRSEVVSGEALGVIYRPIFWAANQVPQFDRCLRWYVGLWINTRTVYDPDQTTPIPP